MKLEGKTAVVTGGGSGIGRSIVHELVRVGARVFTNALDEPGLQETLAMLEPEARERVRTTVSDLSSPPQIERLVETVNREFGDIDILVNNAARHDFSEGALQQSLEKWNALLAINLTAPFLLSQAFLPGMLRKGGGAIVMVSSAAGLVGGGGGVAYTATKHGLLGLTRQLALEFGPQGVRVNAVCPGITRTPALGEALAGPGGDSLRGFIATTAARRAAEPAEIAATVVFLASGEASFMHGAALVVDGGYTIY